MSKFETEIFIKRKMGVSDPAGLAILAASKRLGFESVSDVRTGKYFVVDPQKMRLTQLLK